MKLFYEKFLIGEIVDGKNAPELRYDGSWLTRDGAFPLSATMPMRNKHYPWEVVAPWIVNLLPENSEDLRIIAQNLQVSPADVLGLMAKIGRDTSGAVSFAERGSDGDEVRLIESAEHLERIIEELPRKPFLAGEDGVSMSLAGVQQKIGLRVLEDGSIGVPINGSPSSHILKPDSARLIGGVQNEALCLTLARLCDLPAPNVRTGRAGGRSYLLVERYDRHHDGARLRRIHQEDFCQALGALPSMKYQHNSVPLKKGERKIRFSALVDRTRELAGVQDALQLWNMMLFNVHCGNTDAHAKNYSLLIHDNAFSLAPIYDVMCAQAWEGITPYLAFDVADQRKPRDIEMRHWQRAARECGFGEALGPATAVAMAQKINAAMPTALTEVRAMAAGDHYMLDTFAHAIGENCDRTIEKYLTFQQ